MVDYVYYYRIKNKKGEVIFEGYARELYQFLKFDPQGETVMVQQFQRAAREQLSEIGLTLEWEKRPRATKRYTLDLSHLEE
jgi:hypothetical protein